MLILKTVVKILCLNRLLLGTAMINPYNSNVYISLLFAECADKQFEQKERKQESFMLLKIYCKLHFNVSRMVSYKNKVFLRRVFLRRIYMFLRTYFFKRKIKKRKENILALIRRCKPDPLEELSELSLDILLLLYLWVFLSFCKFFTALSRAELFLFLYFKK